MSVLIEPPSSTEYSPGFEPYVSKARHIRDLTASLAEQLEEVQGLLGPLDASRQLHRYAEGKWSVKEVLGHLTDCERIFTYRLLRFARNDETPVPGFDENVYVAAADFDESDWSGLLEEFALVRNATILLLQHLPEVAWARTGTSNNREISVRALAFIIFGHVEHHMTILKERYL